MHCRLLHNHICRCVLRHSTLATNATSSQRRGAKNVGHGGPLDFRAVYRLLLTACRKTSEEWGQSAAVQTFASTFVFIQCPGQTAASTFPQFPFQSENLPPASFPSPPVPCHSHTPPWHNRTPRPAFSPSILLPESFWIENVGRSPQTIVRPKIDVTAAAAATQQTLSFDMKMVHNEI